MSLRPLTASVAQWSRCGWVPLGSGQTTGAVLGGVGIGLLGASTTLVVGSSVAGVITLIGLFGPFPHEIPTVTAKL